MPGYTSEYRVSGDQWARHEFDLYTADLLSTAITNGPFRTHIGWVDGRGDWTAEVMTTNSYDGRHNLLNTTVLTNCTVAGGQLQSAGHFGTWTNGYDARDNLIITRNALNQVTRYVYDAKDQLLFITNALNQVTRMAYDQNGNLTNLVDALLRTNRWLYDGNGRQFRSIYANGASNSLGYDAIGRLNAVTNHGSGLYLRYAYDNLDRMTDVLFPDGTANRFQYGCCGLELTTDRLSRSTFYDHDALGRVNRVTDPAGRVTEFGHNGADQITNLITTVAGQQRVKKFDYTSTNGFSRLTKVTTPMGKLTRYDYTFRGGLAWREDGNGNVTKFQYDPPQRLVSVTDSANNPLVEMAYDVLGNVTSVSSVNSVFNYSYDSLNRATNVVCLLTNIPGFATVKYQIAYIFDPVGNVTNRLISGLQGFTDTIQTRYRYDAMNRLTNVQQRTNGVWSAVAVYSYDEAGRLRTKTYGNFDIVTHAYDQESHLLSLAITNGSTLVTRYNYQWDAGGNILAITNCNTNVTLYAYDRAGQLTNEIAFTNGLSGRVTNAWQYDDAGNWITSPGEGKWRVYNADNELIGISTNSAYTVTVTGQVDPGPNNNKWYKSWAECRGVRTRVSPSDGTFSLAGVPLQPGTNVLVVTVTDVSGNTYQTNRTVIKGGHESFRYDGNGNLTNWVNGATNWVYEWDWADRLVKVSSNGVVVLENWYDANGRRVAKKEVVSGQTKKWLYLYDGWEIVGVMNEAGQLRETFTRGVELAGDIGTLIAVTHHSGSSVTPGTYYAHHNHRGDIVLSRSGTTTVGSYEYSVFGNLKSQLGNDVCRFKFSSKEREVTCGFSYYGYRFYAPQWQRWVNQDPIGELGGLNRYTFVGNNAVGRTDPYGLKIWLCTAPTAWPSPPVPKWARHAYLWDDSPGTPKEKRECGMGNSLGMKGNSSDNVGPSDGETANPWKGKGPRGETECYQVDDSSGKEGAVMECCRQKANSGVYVPYAHDCHDAVDRCLKENDLTPPPHSRGDPISNHVKDIECACRE